MHYNEGMKKSLAVLFFLSCLALFSCNKGVDTSNGSSVPHSDTHSLVDQNGDFLYRDPRSFADLPNIYPSGLIKKAEMHTPTIFVNTVFDCSHCQKLEPIFAEAMKKTGFYIETLNRKENPEDQSRENHIYFQALGEMQSHYGNETGIGIDGSTPRLYLAKEQTLTYFEGIYDNANNANKFTSYLCSIFQKTEIYHFTSFDAFCKGYENDKQSTLTIIIDEANDDALDFYCKTLYPIAKSSKKKLFFIDVRRFNDNDKKDLQTYFSLDSIPPTLLYQNESINYFTDQESAVSLINRYYS